MVRESFLLGDFCRFCVCAKSACRLFKGMDCRPHCCHIPLFRVYLYVKKDNRLFAKNNECHDKDS